MQRRRPDPRDRLTGWRQRLRALVNRKATERELSAELAFHLEMETEKNIRNGMDPVVARREAMLAFGGVDRFSEDVRDVRNLSWFEDLRHDLRHAARAFRRTPGFTLAAVAALALGIGANTAVFSVLHAVVIAPLPYAEPERLVRLWESSPVQGVERGNVSPGTFVDLRTRSRTLERIALFSERTFLLSNEEETFDAPAAAVSPALFEMLGVRPILGRTFPPDEGPQPYAGSGDELVIGYDLWQSRFGGAPDVVGRTIRIDARWSYTIVGVAPRGFSYPVGTQMWMPLIHGRTVSANTRQHRYYSALGKVRSGYTLAQAAGEVGAIAAQLGSEYPASNAGWTVELSSLGESIVGTTRRTLLVLFGLAGCVLLVACGNVATLAVARAAARRHETAVRLALGAGRRRLLRQWLAEGLLLAVLGGAGGAVVGYWSSRLLLAIAPADIPRLDEVAFRGPVLLFAALVTCAAALLVGLAPTFRSRESGPVDALRSRGEGAGSSGARMREWLVGTQVALTFVLVVAAALLLRSFARLHATDLGFRPNDVLSAELRVPGGRFPRPNPWVRRMQYYDQLVADLHQVPGVRTVAGTTNIPLTGEMGPGSMWRTDAPGAHGRVPPSSASDQWKAGIQIVTPKYFATMGTPIVRGRDFDDTDRFSEQQFVDSTIPRPPGVAIINEAMATRFWPDGDPLGATIFLQDDETFAAYRTIVGVVRDARAESVAAPATPSVFLPFAQHPGRGLSLVVGTDVPPERLVGPVSDRLRAFDAALSITRVRPLDAVVGGSLSRPRFTLVLVASFAVLALTIAGVGVFGIVAFLVTRRTPEIGIRIALGARPGEVLRLVLTEGLRPVLLGVAGGVLGAIAVARAMRALLYGLAPIDVASFAMAAGLMLLASFVATIVPARRAAGVDPLRSLRSE